jgi:hypothetical protein
MQDFFGQWGYYIAGAEGQYACARVAQFGGTSSGKLVCGFRVTLGKGSDRGM